MTMPVLMIVFLSLFQTLASLPSAQGKEKLEVYRLYDGPQRPPAEIAVLRAGKRWRSLYLLSVDGRKPLDGEKSYGKGFSIELLPGPHVLEVEVISSIPAHRSAKLVVPLRFTVEAGHQYVIAGGEI